LISLSTGISLVAFSLEKHRIGAYMAFCQLPDSMRTTGLILLALSSCLQSSFVVDALSPPSAPADSIRRSSSSIVSRRDVMRQTATTTSLLILPFPSIAATTTTTSVGFQTKAQAEYTNSITASRDTNVSPLEAYESIMKYIPPASSFLSSSSSSTTVRALDVGAGAGLSTSYLYNQLGYKYLDAVDWSGDAWRQNVVSCPETVQFYEMDDDAFFQSLETTNQEASSQNKNDHVQQQPHQQYQVICYNFAINPQKAVRVARRYLSSGKNDSGGAILFAPVNDKTDYWYKQTYYAFNNKGEVVSQSGSEVGAFYIQYQPDVNSNSCTGIWCGDFNGYNNNKKKKQANIRQT
jgi:hypothetical protein